MKIRLNFEKTNLIRLIVAMIFAAVLYYKVAFPVYVLAGFGVSYFLIKSLSVELNNKWLRLALGILMLGGSSVMTAHMVQYLLLDAELRARIMDNKMFLNVLCCLVVYLVVQVFTKNVGLTCVISHIALMTFAGINYFVYLFRGNEFIFSDLRSISTGLSVAGNYEFVLDDRAAYVVLLSALYVAFVRKIHVMFEKRIWMAAVCISVVICCCAYIGTETEGTVTETWEQKGSYRNGYLLNFALSVRDSFIAEPDGYSEEVISELEDQYSGDGESYVNQDVEKNPTIIVVMSESYADLSVVGDFLTNEQVTPYYDSLQDNIMKGHALSSVFGAKTPNSEWEYMTGNSMAFLPSGSVVYQQYISDTPTSIVSNLKNIGYTCVAMHPYYETGWSRNAVYPTMGFDETHFIDDFDQTKLLRKYITDQELYESIVERYESKKANEDLFIMSISMQNHGGYSQSTLKGYEPDVKLNYETEYPEAQTYLSLARESDKAFQNLVEYFEKVDEPTMIVMFGDHWPKLEEGFLAEVLGKDREKLDLFESQVTYTTPYVIWTNYSSETAEEDISANYLGSYVLFKAGISLPFYNQFLMKLKKQLPVIGVGAVCDQEGNWYASEDLPDNYRQFLSDYNILEYNNQFEKKDVIESLFTIGN